MLDDTPGLLRAYTLNKASDAFLYLYMLNKNTPGVKKRDQVGSTS